VDRFQLGNIHQEPRSRSVDPERATTEPSESPPFSRHAMKLEAARAAVIEPRIAAKCHERQREGLLKHSLEATAEADGHRAARPVDDTCIALESLHGVTLAAAVARAP
jgi:hypothetical protein